MENENKITILEVKDAIIDSISECIMRRVAKFGAWADWYNSEETENELNCDFSVYDIEEVTTYESENPDTTIWEAFEEEIGCGYGLHDLYSDALSQCMDKLKFKVALPIDNGNWQPVHDYWYGINKKKLAECLFEDCCYFEFVLDEDNRISEEDILGMIEEI